MGTLQREHIFRVDPLGQHDLPDRFLGFYPSTDDEAPAMSGKEDAVDALQHALDLDPAEADMPDGLVNLRHYW
ncbi:MAG: hypothetical protein R3185_02120 [Candidatus Thermoplasmatota archaeon]|nr:hypothetical protein [Candidatus Thermoplasmatota archaeon]